MPTDTVTREVTRRCYAMATDIIVRAVVGMRDEDVVTATSQKALDVFTQVDATCTRFNDSSPLMQANAEPTRWHSVPPTCFAALLEAHDAYVATEGRFDPRVLSDLVRLGYAKSMSTGVPESVDAPHAHDRREPLPPWQPKFRADTRAVQLGALPVDLGGIGKGLAVRWAAQQLRKATPDFFVEAGGDCYCSGQAPEGGLWRVAVEDPSGEQSPVAVLALTDRGCATSSVRIRQWHVDGKRVHHLIDPRTGQSGSPGVQAVTVVDRDPATAEVWSKTLFLAGRSDISAMAEVRGLAALWIDSEGRNFVSTAMRPYVIWRSS